jgi:hypothetical protein
LLLRCGEESVVVKVLRSIVRGPLERHIVGFADELLRQGYSRSAAEQHVCFIAHWTAGCRPKASGWRA